MRRVSREDVFKLVFEFTFLRERNESTLALLLADAELDDADREYIRSTYDGVTGDFDRLTEKIASKLERYRVERLYRPDYAVLLLGVYELERGDLPASVVINEAVELTKKFGGEGDYQFVNGLLGSVVRELGLADSAPTVEQA